MFAWLRRKPPPIGADKRRVLAALAGYPLYDPPRWISETKSFQAAAAEYTEFFLKHRNQRIEALSGFLAEFEVELSLNDEGLMAVSEWCPAYLDLMVDGLMHQGDAEDSIWCAYHWLETPWTDSLIGLNPILDLGIYMGECMLSRNPRLNWHPVVNPERDKGARHPIFGQSCGRSFDPIKWTYTECKNVHSATITKQRHDTTRLYGTVHGRALE